MNVNRSGVAMALAVVLAGCGSARINDLDQFSSDPFDVVIVPGCPSLDDGALSGCQWSRVVWAAELYDRGLVHNFITSGSAVYNPYVEAEALKAGLVELGVPAERIVVEPDALHTDENAAYSYLIAQEHDWQRIGVASQRGHAAWIDKLIEAWTDHDVTTLPMDTDFSYGRVQAGMPRVTTAPIDNWIPLDERERAIAKASGKRKRGSSAWKYFRASLAPGLTHPPDLPPEHLRTRR